MSYFASKNPFVFAFDAAIHFSAVGYVFSGTYSLALQWQAISITDWTLLYSSID